LRPVLSRLRPSAGGDELPRRRLLLGGGDFGGGFGVLFGEAFDAAGGVHELLLAGEEGMAARADFDLEGVALDGRTSREIVPASAVHGNSVIVGVNTGFHVAPVCRVRSARPPRQGQRTTAASLGREAIVDYTLDVAFLQKNRQNGARTQLGASLTSPTVT